MAPIILFIKSKVLSFAPSSPFSWPQIFPKASLCCCLLSSPAERVTKVETLSVDQPFQGILKGYQCANVCMKQQSQQTERGLGNSKVKVRKWSQTASWYVITYGKLLICLKVTLLTLLRVFFDALWENIMVETSSQWRLRFAALFL